MPLQVKRNRHIWVHNVDKSNFDDLAQTLDFIRKKIPGYIYLFSNDFIFVV